MKKLEFFEIVDAICRQPRMYTPTGTFYEAVCFIEGLASVHLDLGKFSGHSKMTPFLYWRAESLGVSTAEFRWNEFRERYDSDRQAFEDLPKLYEEYVKSEK